jgi:hypothetical protein
MKNIEETRARYKEIVLLLDKHNLNEINPTPAQSQFDLTPGKIKTISEKSSKKQNSNL